MTIVIVKKIFLTSFLTRGIFFLELETDLGVEHLADLRYPDGDPPCHFCCQQTSTSIHDENRLKIMSGGKSIAFQFSQKTFA